MSKPKTIAERIDDIRARIAALSNERHELIAQQRSRVEVGESINRLLSHWQDKGETAIVRELQRAAVGSAPEVLTVKGNAAVSITPGNAPLALDLGPLLVALFGDVLRTRIGELLEQVPEGVESATRRARTTEIDRELDRVESEEESLIEQSEIDGDPIVRRPDARPEIVLALKM